ncbi:MAG: hypothetical protein V3U75_10435 [Methylococcaceae bacterium]
MDREVASPGEVKILLNLDWKALPGSPALRNGLDRAAARIVTAIFLDHDDISKIRVILKIPKKKRKNVNINENRMGRSLGYTSVAKVFSFTRATWELAWSQNDILYDPETTGGPANILALGDYVVRTEEGWK